MYIPVQGTEEEVRVALDQLPHDASDILDILKAEQAPLHLWLIIAVTFPLPISLMLAVPRISQGSLGLFGLLGLLAAVIASMRQCRSRHPCLRLLPTIWTVISRARVSF